MRVFTMLPMRRWRKAASAAAAAEAAGFDAVMTVELGHTSLRRSPLPRLRPIGSS